MPSFRESPFENNCRIQRAATVLTADLGGDTVLMDAEQGLYFDLNQTAADIWKRLHAPTTVEALVQDLTDRYNAGEANLEQEVRALLEEMLSNHLVEVCR